MVGESVEGVDDKTIATSKNALRFAFLNATRHEEEYNAGVEDGSRSRDRTCGRIGK